MKYRIYFRDRINGQLKNSFDNFLLMNHPAIRQDWEVDENGNIIEHFAIFVQQLSEHML